MIRTGLILVLFGLAPHLAFAAGTPSPASNDPAAACPAAGNPLEQPEFLRPAPRVERCSATVTCPDGSVLSCMGWECGVFWQCGTGVECGITCLLGTSSRYCPGYNADNCGCGG